LLACNAAHQWRIYIEAKEAVLESPGLKGPPKFIKINFKKGKKYKMIKPLVKKWSIGPHKHSCLGPH